MQVAQSPGGGGKTVKRKKADTSSVGAVLFPQADREITPFGLMDRAAEAVTGEQPYLAQVSRGNKDARAAQNGQDLDQAVQAAQRGETVRPDSWTEYETGLQDWTREADQVIAQAQKDSDQRDGVWQDTSAFDAYRQRQNDSITRLRQQASLYRDFFDSHRDVYGDQEVDGILSTLERGGRKLTGVHKLLDEEGKFRGQFLDQGEFDTYQRLSKSNAEGLKQWNEELNAARDEITARYRTTGDRKTYLEEIGKVQQVQNKVMARYYQLDNEQKLAQLEQSQEAMALYSQAEAKAGDADGMLQRMRDRLDRGGRPEEDPDALAMIEQVYGISPSKSGSLAQYMNDLQSISGLPEGETEALAGLGYDYYRMARYQQTQKDAERYENEQKALREWTKESTWNSALGSFGSILASPFQAVDAIDRAIRSLTQGNEYDIEHYEPLNVYNMGPTNYVSGVRGTVAEQIEDSTQGMELFGRNVPSFLYQTGMSIGDSALQVGLMGGASLPIMGGAAAANQMQDIIARGGNNTQAFLGGTAAGAAEMLFEKFSVESLLAPKSVTDWKSLLKETAKQSLVELTEEGATEIANILSDAAIMGRDSTSELAVRAYMMQGISEEEARKKVFFDQIGQVVEAGVGGALSGGIMGGATGAVNWALGGGRSNSVEAMQYQNREGNPQSAPPAQTAPFEKGAEGQADPLVQAAREMAGQEESPRPFGPPPFNKGGEGQSVQRTGADTAGQQRTAQDSPRRSVPPASERADQTEQRTAAMENASALVKASEVFGENGQKAFAAAWDGQSDSASYYAGFSTWYQAGLTGKAQSRVRGPYAGAVNEAQRLAAYASGQRDAAANLAKEKAAAPYAKTAGDGAGLVYDEYVAQAVENPQSVPPAQTAHFEKEAYFTAETAERINAVAKELGVRVRLVDSVAEGQANGQYSGSEILIAKDAADPLSQVFGHEITHRVQELAPETYRVFREAALDHMADSAARAKIDDYRAQGMTIQYEAAMDDVAADYAGQLLEDGRVLDEFIDRHRADRTLLQKLRDVFRGLWQKLTGAEKRKAQTAEGKLSAALDAAAEQAGVINPQSAAQTAPFSRGPEGQTRYSLKKYSPERVENWSGSKNIVVYKDQAQARRFIQNAIDGHNLGKKLYFGAISSDLAARIEADTGVDVEGYNCSLGANEIRKIFKDHGNEQTENRRGQRAITTDDILSIQDIIQAPDEIRLSEKLYNGKPAIEFVKTINGKTTVVSYVSDKHMDLTVQTMYSGKMKEGLATPTGEQAPVNTPEARSGTALQSITQDISGSYGDKPQATFLRDTSMDSVPQSGGENNPQYSLKGATITKTYNQLLKENDALRERLDYWRGQTKTTKEVTVDKKAVEKASKEIIKEYESDIDAGELSGRLQALYDHMARAWYANGEVENSDAWKGAEEIARDIAESAVSEWSLSEEFPGLREKLRGTPITISHEYDNDLHNENFRREYRGKLKLSAQGPTNVDAVYAELSESYPGLFPADITHPADQLEKIMDVADSLHTMEQQSRFSGQMEEAVTGITNEIVEQFLDLPLTRATFADQQAMKLDKLRAENREAVQNAIARERSAREKQVAELKDKYKARTEAGRERQSAAELRGKITRHAKSLSDKLLRPTDKAHIPEELRGPVAKVLESINLESQYTIDPETGKRVKGGDGDPVKRTQAFLEMKQKYAEINKSGGDLVIDPALLGSNADGIQGSLDAVIAMGDTPIASMNSEQLSTMWQVLKSVEHSVSTAGKLLSKAKYERTSQWADALERDTRTRRDKRSLTKNHATLDLENPYTFFSHFGQAGKDMYRTLRDAQDRQQVLTDLVSDETAKVVDEKTAKKLEKATHDYTTEGGQKVTLSTAQVMELYELSKRRQARDHLLVGGIVQPEIKGTKVRRGTEAIRLTQNDLAEITGSLNAEEKGIADGLQKLTATVLADMGNEASMAAYGYKKFTEADYWPIRSAREGLHSSIEKGGDNARSIKNIGMAQATVPHANNQVDIGSIFDTFARHTGDMVDYAAWLCPMEDLNRVYNFQFRDGEGNPTGWTVKGLLDAKGGEGAQKYWHDLMEDIQNGIKAKNDSPIGAIASKGIGAFKGAAVGGNIRVIIQQPTAFFRAGAVLNPADMALGLAKGATKGNGWKKALQYSPIAMRKNAGGFDISSPGTMKETLFGGKGAVDKVNDALSWGAGKADAVTWGRLWNASEWQVTRQHKDMKKGSKAFYEEVNRVFTDMVDQTQVVDGILQRSNIMRSQNAMVQQATSFMGEPIMSLNLTMRAWDQLRNEQDPKKRGKAIRNLGRAATALTVTAAVNAVAQSLVDAMRDDDKDKKYWERFQSAFTGLEGDEETPWEKAQAAIMGNLGEGLNPAGQIPYVKDMLSLMQGYDVSRTEFAVIQDLIEAGQSFVKSADGSGPRTRSYALNKLFTAGAKLFGIPAANLERDIWAFGRSVVTETGNLPAMYKMEKAIYNVGNEKNKSRFVDIMYRALETGELDTYQHIQEDLMNEMGLEGTDLESALKGKYKAKLKDDPSYTLPQGSYDLLGIRPEVKGKEKEDKFGEDDLDSAAFRKYTVQRARDFGAASNALAGSPIFKGMDEDTRNKVLQAAYDLAESGALADASDGQYTPNETWILEALEAEKKGIEPWEFALWRVAKSDAADTKGADGKAVKGETKKDHVMDWLSLSGLSEEQQEFLWGTAYTSDFDEYRDDLAEYRSYGPQMEAAYGEMSSGLEDNPIFAGMDAELREKVTDAAMEVAKQTAKSEAVEGYEYETQWIAKADEAETQGIPTEEYVMWHVVCGNTYSDRDANGNEIQGQRKQDHLRAWLRSNNALTEQQRYWLWRQQYKTLPW